MSNAIHRNAVARHLTLFAVAATVVALVAPTGCDHDDRDFDDVHPANEHFFQLGDGRYLQRVTGPEACAFVFEYDHDGQLAYVGTPDNSFLVDYSPFRLRDEQQPAGKFYLYDFNFTKKGYIEKLTYERRSSEPYEDTETAVQTQYNGSRLTQLTLHTTGQRAEENNGGDRPERPLNYERSATYDLSWDADNNIAFITVAVLAKANEQTVSNLTTTYHYTYGRREDRYRQMPMSVAAVFADLDFLATVGLLGYGPEFLPTAVERSVVNNLLTDNDNATNDNATASESNNKAAVAPDESQNTPNVNNESTALRTVVNSDGTLAAENQWTYYYGYFAADDWDHD